MQPLKIVARMGEPVICFEDGLHLDGILAWAAYRDLTEEEHWRLPPIQDPWAVDFDLPFARWSMPAETPSGASERLLDDAGNVWGWFATMAIADWTRRSVHEIRKRVPTSELARWAGTRSINVGAGAPKAYDLKLPTMWTPEITWFAIGDLDEILRLLSIHVYGIGKHCAKGMGRVLEWKAEQVKIDEQFILARRRMPANSDEAMSISSVRPPYHHISRQTYAVDPVAELLIPPTTKDAA